MNRLAIVVVAVVLVIVVVAMNRLYPLSVHARPSDTAQHIVQTHCSSEECAMWNTKSHGYKSMAAYGLCNFRPKAPTLCSLPFRCCSFCEDNIKPRVMLWWKSLIVLLFQKTSALTQEVDKLKNYLEELKAASAAMSDEKELFFQEKLELHQKVDNLNWDRESLLKVKTVSVTRFCDWSLLRRQTQAHVLPAGKGCFRWTAGRYQCCRWGGERWGQSLARGEKKNDGKAQRKRKGEKGITKYSHSFSVFGLFSLKFLAHSLCD